MTTTFEAIANRLVKQFGSMTVPASAVDNAIEGRCELPDSVRYVKTEGSRGGRYDLSAFVSQMIPEVMVKEVTTADAVLTEDRGEAMSVEQRFDALEVLAKGIVNGSYRSLIASGNPGIGKTYTLEKILKDAMSRRQIRSLRIVKGFSRATGIYRLLYENRHAGNVVVFDDCDSVFGDETGLNLFKAALDTTETRIVSWHSERPFKDEDGEKLPNTFEFEGTVIFVTNLNFDAALNTKLGPHLSALLSRSLYVDLNMSSREDLLRHIGRVMEHSTLLPDAGVPVEAAPLISLCLKVWAPRLRETSLRTVVKLAKILKASESSEDFLKVAQASCCKVA